MEKPQEPAEPSVTCEIDGGSPAVDLPTTPVSLKGKIAADGYVSENDAWFDRLTKDDDETGRADSKGRLRRIGRDPMSIPVDVLTAAGHPPSRTRSIVGRLSKTLHEEPTSEFREYRDLRRYCLECADGPAEVRRCSIINCPLWPYRMGKNPHNPKRGVNPFNGGE